VFLGTCAETLQRALEPANGGDAAVLDAPHLAGFILRGDPDEGAIARVRARLDARGAAHLALGRSMHGMPRPPRCTDDPSSAATVADFTLVAPFRPAITAKPPGTELRDTCPRVPPEHGAGGAAGGDVFARPRASTPLSAAGLSRWIAATPHVVAMGGIDVASGSEAVALGAEGIAGIDAFFGDASRVAQNALAFAALFPRA
jgi:hypothetical protein